MRYNLVIAFCQQIPNSLSGHLTYSHLQKFGTEQSLCVYLVLLQKLFFLAVFGSGCGATVGRAAAYNTRGHWFEFSYRKSFKNIC